MTKTEEYLEYLKKDYEKTEATMHLKIQGWKELQKRIDLISPRPARSGWFNFAITFALILLFVGSLFGAYRVTLAAVPGDLLYPVKILSEKIIEKSSGNNQVVINHRADEILNLSKQREINKEDLRQVVQDYKENVEEAKNDLKISGKPSIDFQQSLDEQHTEFNRIEKDHPDIKSEIEDAQKVSEHSNDRSDERRDN